MTLSANLHLWSTTGTITPIQRRLSASGVLFSRPKPEEGGSGAYALGPFGFAAEVNLMSAETVTHQ